jgi:RNA polymerase sigma factor (sigma-70 family)
VERGTVITMTERQSSVLEMADARADSLSPELLFRRHYRPLVAALAVACGSRELAADCVQDAFVELCKRWGKIGGYERPEAWLMRVAANRARSEQRSLRRHGAELTKALVELELHEGNIGQEEAERQIQAGIRRAKVAEECLDTSFSLLFGQGLVVMYGALEALVKDLLANWLANVPSAMDSAAFPPC